MMDIIMAGIVIIAECARTAGSAVGEQLANIPRNFANASSHSSPRPLPPPTQRTTLPFPINTSCCPSQSQAKQERSKLTNSHNNQPARNELAKI